ncbi:MAG: hypothetical protein R3300_04230 [Candidatus Promineifilaceae bacterium]|nr:hypothetical protein [Candidatus Promineifilaceae bacterium]
MDATMIVLRLIHIFSGVYWLGATFLLVSFVTPTVQATGEEGRAFMQHLAFRTRFTMSLAATGGLTILSGLIMWVILFGDGRGLFSNPYALTLTIGAVFGLAAFAVGFVFQNRSSREMRKVYEAIQAGDGPPQPEQMAEMKRLSERINFGSRLTALLMTGALVGMSIAQYVV